MERVVPTPRLALSVTGERVAIVEAYSPDNLGDAELVRQSIRVVRRRWPEAEVDVIALDVDGFSSRFPHERFHTRVFDRKALRRLAPSGQLRRLAAWAIQITLVTAVAISFPGPWGRRIAGNIHLGGGLSWQVLLKSSRVVAVGGGYLGNQYIEESVLTLWLWWVLSRLGIPVSSLPLSVSDARGPLFVAFRLFGRRVHWVAREEYTSDVLASMGLSAEVCPDLAFLRASDTADELRPGGVLVAPVGTTYLSPVELESVLDRIAKSIHEHPGGPHKVSIACMHSARGQLGEGGDDVAASLLAEALMACGVEALVVDVHDFDDIMSLARVSSLTIACRMHAAIAAVCAGCPTAVLGYEPKHAAVFALVGLEDVCIDIRSSQKAIGDLLEHVAMMDRHAVHSAALEAGRRVDEWIGQKST